MCAYNIVFVNICAIKPTTLERHFGFVTRRDAAFVDAGGGVLRGPAGSSGEHFRVLVSCGGKLNLHPMPCGGRLSGRWWCWTSTSWQGSSCCRRCWRRRRGRPRRRRWCWLRWHSRRHRTMSQNQSVHLLKLGSNACQLLNGIVLEQVVGLREAAGHLQQRVEGGQLALLVGVLALQDGDPGVTKTLVVSNLRRQLRPLAHTKDVAIAPARLLAHRETASEAHLTLTSSSSSEFPRINRLFTFANSR